MVDVAGLGNEGLGTISLTEGRKADKALPLFAAPQPPTVLNPCSFLEFSYK